ncbi:HAMP domain-containing histidine kinase [Paenibacillus sp. N1-5-1-14]|uniref:sensor histidine kinase n=1 Tax=Paenibacillus radicibacter TaxID=2972488 RepID=UPI00215977C1|nr:HAMP domain-containing sensor histidine kinase [Paenibacillus radicibacter]MCR8644261.1 HAMP domain-containing histidine kinase [Paenibacillus radicibacter]
MKGLRIRQWMMIGMLIVLIIPRLFYEIPNLIEHYGFENTTHIKKLTALDTIMLEVNETPVTHWLDPNWQQTLRNIADSLQLGVVLLDASNQEIVRIVPSNVDSNVPARQISVTEQGKVLGSALFFIPANKSWVANILALVAGLIAILFIGWQMGRVVVKPLEAMSAAARRIASGDLDFQLPKSTVLEVADVRSAFQAMGTSLKESLIRQSILEEERRFFISSIAHDLRSPLFVLRGYLSRLTRDTFDQPDKTTKSISICSKKAAQLERLVSDLFSYSQMASFEQIMRLGSIEITALFQEIVVEYMPIANEKEITITFVAPNEQRNIQGDAHLLSRAIGNLIDNAIRHTPIHGTINICLQLELSRIHFTIEDTGLGFPDHMLNNLFKAFYRGDDSRNPDHGGTGLGLVIAKRVLEAHNGDLTANNSSLSGGAILTGWIS